MLMGPAWIRRYFVCAGRTPTQTSILRDAKGSFLRGKPEGRSMGFRVGFNSPPALGAWQRFLYCELRHSGTAWLKSPPDSWGLRPGPSSLIPENEEHSCSPQARWDVSVQDKPEEREHQWHKRAAAPGSWMVQAMSLLGH